MGGADFYRPMTEPTTAAPELPRTPAGTPARGRQVLTGVLLLVLLVASWRAYDWFVDNVAQRQAIAEGRLPNPAAAPADDSNLATSAQPMPSAAPAADTMAAPAVRGDAIHRCVQGDREVFTNQACPEGFVADSGLSANAPRLVAATVPQDGGNTSPEQRIALCQYLLAEVQRLNFEFQQPLPPPVLDRISTRLGVLRDQGEQLQCPLPKSDARPARSAESEPPPKGR